MAVNPDSIPRYEQPMDQPEPTACYWMDRCKHCAACQRAYLTMGGDGEGSGWAEEMARRLGCDECEEWD